MAEQDMPIDARVQILRVAESAVWGNLFASKMAGNRIANVGGVDLGSGRLQVVLAERNG